VSGGIVKQERVLSSYAMLITEEVYPSYSGAMRLQKLALLWMLGKKKLANKSRRKTRSS